VYLSIRGRIQKRNRFPSIISNTLEREEERERERERERYVISISSVL